MKLIELMRKREAAIANADAILATAEKDKRNMTPEESAKVDECLAEVAVLSSQVKQISSLNTLREQFVGKTPIFDGAAKARTVKGYDFMTAEYHKAFWSSLGSAAAMQQNAALYEGSNSGGGYAVPIEVDGTIVPLADQEFAIRQLARVVTTTNDVKLPIQSTRATASAKAESGGSDHSFTATAPTLTQKTLSAYMAGGYTELSWEIQQDVGLLESLASPDLVNAVRVYEEGKFISGAGTTEPEGVLTGADFGVANEDMDLDRILDHIGTLKAEYHRNASFLMHRTTSIAIRKAQLAGNLFDPVWTRVGNQDYLYGYPAFYSSSMPEIGQGNKVMVFGDFKSGFLIGDRGGAGISVKVLDQTKALLGLIQVMAYRRTDSLVRRSEALKTFIIDSAS